MIGDSRHVTALGMLREGKSAKNVARLCNIRLAEVEAVAGLTREEADAFVRRVRQRRSARIGASTEDGDDAV